MKNKNIIIVGIVALIIGVAGGFFGGMQYQQNKLTAGRTQFTAGNFTRGGNTAAGTGRTEANGMAVRGQIISADSNSITVKLQDGSTKIVVLGSTATIAKTTTGSASDLTNGAEVTVFGTTNSDGTVSATNVQVGNVGQFGGPRPSGSPIPTPSSQ
ncbi:hypothetical protein BH10PAT1_BH10PAT1_6180 [soil metagenome]